MKRLGLKIVGEYYMQVDFNPLFQPSRLIVTLHGNHPSELTLQFETPVAKGNLQCQVNEEVRSLPFLTTAQQSEVIWTIMDRAEEFDKETKLMTRYEGVFVD